MSRPAGSNHKFGSAVAWSTTAVLLVAVLLRLCWFDGTYVLVWLNAFTRYLYLPAYACLGWAIWRRRPALAVLNALIVAFHVAMIGPDFVPLNSPEAQAGAEHAASPAQARHSVDVRLLYANVCIHNRNFSAVFDAIDQTDADVVALVELGARWFEAAEKSPVMNAFPNQHVSTPPGGELAAVYSHFPTTKARADPFLKNRALPLDLHIGDERARLLTIHAPRPVGYKWELYGNYWRRIEQLLNEQPEPLIVLGDFNATQYSQVYGRVTSGRLRDAHRDRGRGYATTWPGAIYWAPPIRIDHALLSPGVRCLKIGEVTIPGSDHRGLVLDLRLE